MSKKTKTSKKQAPKGPALSAEARAKALAGYAVAEAAITNNFNAGLISSPTAVRQMQKLTTRRNQL